MLTRIGVFSILKGAVSQHFLASSSANPRTDERAQDDSAVLARLDELATRLAKIEAGLINGEQLGDHARDTVGVQR
jgi:hypothetical protein